MGKIFKFICAIFYAIYGEIIYKKIEIFVEIKFPNELNVEGNSSACCTVASRATETLGT